MQFPHPAGRPGGRVSPELTGSPRPPTIRGATEAAAGPPVCIRISERNTRPPDAIDHGR